MSETYFTSDSHFGHARILELSNRPFKTVAEMEEVLVANWNARVAAGDTVYHLGDFAMHPRDDIPRILARLNGTIVLVDGNHDHKKTLTHFGVVHRRIDLTVDGVDVHMVHNPAQAHAQPNQIVLCGHVHEKWARILPGGTVPADDTADHAYKSSAFVASVPYYNVGVDVRGFQPVTLAEILRA
jgi:calcineurin-like phosphoesterase family protein